MKRTLPSRLNQKNFMLNSLEEMLTKIFDNNADLILKRKNMLKNDSENSLIKIEKEVKKLI